MVMGAVGALIRMTPTTTRASKSRGCNGSTQIRADMEAGGGTGRILNRQGARNVFRAMVGAAKRRMKAEDGFTLIELAVVMLIIAILVVVSLAFFGLIGTAHSSVGLQDLRGADTAAKTLWTQNGGSFSGVTAAKLDAAEPGVAFQLSAATITTNPNSISVNFGAGGNSALFEAYSAANGGECVALLDIANTASPLAGSTYFNGAGAYWGEGFTTLPAGDTAASGVAAPVSNTCKAEVPNTTNIATTGWKQVPPGS